jgi:hypothetical protein
MYEAKHHAVLPRRSFFWRLAQHFLAALGLLIVSLALGMVGYILTERKAAIDAFLNAAMLLGGMGPVNPPVTLAGKLFAGIFALYAGLVFIVSAALMLTPVLHRVLHQFHFEGTK